MRLDFSFLNHDHWRGFHLAFLFSWNVNISVQQMHIRSEIIIGIAWIQIILHYSISRL